MKCQPRWLDSKLFKKLFKVMDLPSLLSCKRQINYLSLSRIGLQLSCTREAIKRESGESPEQSRCCKFIFWLRAIDFIATGKQIPGRRSQQEQVRRPTMQTRFTAFEEKALSLMNRTSRLSFHSSLWFRESVLKRINSAKFIYACPVEGISPGHF